MVAEKNWLKTASLKPQHKCLDNNINLRSKYFERAFKELERRFQLIILGKVLYIKVAFNIIINGQVLYIAIHQAKHKALMLQKRLVFEHSFV